MAFSFPINPTNNQEYVGPNGVIYTYDGDKWTGSSSGNGYTGSQGVIGYTGSRGYAGSQGTNALWNFVGAYNGNAEYQIGDVVTYEGSTWYALIANQYMPPNLVLRPLDWALIAKNGYTGSQGAIGYTGSVGSSGFEQNFLLMGA